jgi:DNA-binding MarR family transcriptional regulator
MAARFDELVAGLDALRANGFKTTAESAVFCAAARATIVGEPPDLGEISDATQIPYTSVSRILWDLSQRGLVEYGADAADRRRKVIRAKVEAFKL